MFCLIRPGIEPVSTVSVAELSIHSTTDRFCGFVQIYALIKNCLFLLSLEAKGLEKSKNKLCSGEKHCRKYKVSILSGLRDIKKLNECRTLCVTCTLVQILVTKNSSNNTLVLHICTLSKSLEIIFL